jgi:hypothetical protein
LKGGVGGGGGVEYMLDGTRESHWFRMVKTTGKRTAKGLRIIPSKKILGIGIQGFRVAEKKNNKAGEIRSS